MRAVAPTHSVPLVAAVGGEQVDEIVTTADSEHATCTVILDLHDLALLLNRLFALVRLKSIQILLLGCCEFVLANGIGDVLTACPLEISFQVWQRHSS